MLFLGFYFNRRSIETAEEKLKFLQDIAASYRKLWATFDIPLIILGIAAMINACLLHVCFLHYQMKPKNDSKGDQNESRYQNGDCIYEYSMPSGDKVEPFKNTKTEQGFSFLSCSIAVMVSIFAAFHYPVYIAALFAPLAFILMTLTKVKLSYLVHNFPILLSLLLPGLLYGFISGSNSFILNEPHCILYLLNALIAFVIIYGGKSSTFKLSSTLYSVALLVACNLITRGFIQHPESQAVNPILQPLSSIDQDEAHKRLLLTSICLVAYVLLTLKNLFRTDNLSSENFNLVSTWFTVALPVGALCVILYWLQSLQSHSLYEAQSDRVKVLFPRTVYLIIVIAIVLFICEPILVHVKRIRSSKVPQISLNEFNQDSDPTKLIPQLAKSLFPSTDPNSAKNSAKNGVLKTKASKRGMNGVVQNGALKPNKGNQLENSEESSRSSSVSNWSRKSKSSVQAGQPSVSSRETKPALGARSFFQVRGLGSTALASWHLVSSKTLLKTRFQLNYN